MTKKDAKVYSGDSLLITNEEIFAIKIYNSDAEEFEKGTAYLDGDYYYTFKGVIDEKMKDDLSLLSPGIYKHPDTGENVLIEPITDEDKERYTHEEKISSIDPNRIIEMINTKEKILVAIPESSKLFIPVINNDDDILKRLIKKALIEKNIDIDQYKHRFVDKNALFNFKQVIKGKNTLSILLFDRGCEALNLKYTIIVEEMDPDNVIGNPLVESIQSASDDAYEI